MSGYCESCGHDPELSHNACRTCFSVLGIFPPDRWCPRGYLGIWAEERVLPLFDLAELVPEMLRVERAHWARDAGCLIISEEECSEELP